MTAGAEHPGGNPLLDQPLPPRFNLIEPSHVVPAIRTILEQLSRELDDVEATPETGWQETVRPIEVMIDRLATAWGTVGHLMGVKNSTELREAYDTVLGEVVAFNMRLAQSRAVYEKLEAVKAGSEWQSLEAGQRRIIDNLLRDARLSGVGLEGEAKSRFTRLEAELAELYSRFSNNVLDSIKEFSLTLDDHDDIEGLPPSLIQLAVVSARAAGHENASAEDGPWRFTLDPPSFVPFMEHCRRRNLREKVYKSYITRASQGDTDNTSLIDDILAKRHEQALILGYRNYAEMSLAVKMAPDVEAVESLLTRLHSAAFDAASRDLDDVKALAIAESDEEGRDVALWDIPFWAERLRESRYDFNDEELRPYFPLPRVLEGLFELTERLFGVRIKAADGEVPVWHEDVHYFKVHDEGGKQLAAFYLDPYSRPAEKRGGAWMDECAGRARPTLDESGPTRCPVAYLICNQAPPVEGRPSLMNFTEVKILFHEFGHGLQHMLTKVDCGLASGIRGIEWDAVELPSQFMENWCYHRDTLRGLSGHFETGKPLPDELFDKIVAARTYRAGSNLLRQVYFSRIDLELHNRYQPGGGETVFDVQRRIAEHNTVMQILDEDRFLCGFTHIFAGGYAAGYYGYKWAEVLSADAFAAFEEAGLDDSEAVARVGAHYRDNVLASGGGVDPGEVFRRFRGRDATPDALLRHNGLA